MKGTILVACVALALAPLASPAPAAAAEPGHAATAKEAAAGEPDFRGMMRGVLDAWQTMDPSKAAPFYSREPGLAFFDLLPLKYTGWAEYAAGVAASVKDLASLQFRLYDDARVEREGDVAWATGTLRTDVVEKDGTPLGFDTRWTLIWRKTGGSWLIVHEHFSAPLPTSPAGEITPATRDAVRDRSKKEE